MAESLFIDKQTLADIKKYFPPLFKREPDGYLTPERPRMIGIDAVYGIPVYCCGEKLTRDEWTPPKDPFIEFEPKDYGWLRKLGFGTTVKVRTAYLFDNRKLLSTALIL